MLDSLSAEETCHQVLQTLRSSSLIFLVQESPYSAYITIRKRYRKEAFRTGVSYQPGKNFEALNTLKVAHENLIRCYDEMKQKFEETLSECEELHNKATENKMIVNNLHQKLTKAEAESNSKQILESKCEKLVADKKAIKNENDELVKEVNAANVALKSCKKDLKDSAHRYNKKIEEHESKIEELTKFKIMKASEEKEIRNMKKKTEKKLKEVREKEAKLKLDKISLDKQQKHFTNEKEITDANQNLKADTGEHSEPTALGHSSVHHTNLLDLNRLNNASWNDNSLDPDSMTHTSLEPNSMDHTILHLSKSDPTRSNYSSLDPSGNFESNNQELTTLDPTILKPNMYTSATNSLEHNRSQEPDSSTLSHETKLLKELVKELEKNTQNLGRKMDESNLKCLDIKKILDPKSSWCTTVFDDDS